MKLAPLVLTLVAGIAIGWFGRGFSEDSKGVSRTERRNVADRDGSANRNSEGDQDRDSADGTNSGPDHNAGTGGGANRDGTGTETDPAGVEDGTNADKKIDLANDPLAKFIRSQRANWKAFSNMQAKQKLKGLLEGLGFDADVAAQIEAELLADVNRQMDRVVDMMIGTEELEPEAFTAFTGMPSDLSTDIEAKLGTFLDDEQIHSVRERVKQSYKEQLGTMADSQITSMGIQNLTDDQRTRLRDVYTSRDVMTEQFVNFSRLTRDRARLREVMADDKKFEEVLASNMQPMRRSIRDILNPEQYKKYEAFEENIVSGFRMQLKMMQSLYEPKADGSSKDK